MIDNLHLTEEIDWTIVGLYLLLVVFGWMNILAASFTEEFSSILGRQAELW